MQHKKVTVSAIIIPLEAPLPTNFECEHVGPQREVESVVVCHYNDMFDWTFVRDNTPPDAITRVKRFNPRVRYGPNWHLTAFKNNFPKIHAELSRDNPKIVAVNEVPSLTMMNRYPDINLGLPGGKSEGDELFDPELSVVRETNEETCLEVDVSFDRQYFLREKYGIAYPYELIYEGTRVITVTYIILH